jgi:hypothetical protein
MTLLEIRPQGFPNDYYKKIGMYESGSGSGSNFSSKITLLDDQNFEVDELDDFATEETYFFDESEDSDN